MISIFLNSYKKELRNLVPILKFQVFCLGNTNVTNINRNKIKKSLESFKISNPSKKLKYSLNMSSLQLFFSKILNVIKNINLFCF